MNDQILLITDEDGTALWEKPSDCLVANATSIGGRHEFESTEEALDYLATIPGWSVEPLSDDPITFKVLYEDPRDPITKLNDTLVDLLS